MTTKIIFNKIGQEIKRTDNFSFSVHYTCTACADCPDFKENEDGYICEAQYNDLFFCNFHDVYTSIHPECPNEIQYPNM